MTHQQEVEELDARESQTPEAAEFRVVKFLVVLAKQKKFIAKVAIGGILAGIALALLLPRKYEAVTRIMPPQQNQSIATAMLTQLGPLAGLAGKELGLRNNSDLFVALLHSQTIADDLIGRFHLMQVYGKDTLTETRKRLDGVTDINAGREGVITVAVRDKNQDRAADLANGYVEELRQFTQNLAVTEAGHRKLFFEQEVRTAHDELANAELALKTTQETTGMIQLDSQSKAMIDSYMTLRAQMAAKEVQIQSMHSFATSENPDLVRAQQELSALRAEVSRFERGQGEKLGVGVPLENVPKAGLEYVRRLREVKYRETLLDLLIKQYEIARIDEAKDAAIIQVIDKATRPEIQVRNWLVRLMIAIAIALFAFLAAIGGAFLKESIERARQNSQYAAHINLFRFYLFSRSNNRDSG